MVKNLFEGFNLNTVNRVGKALGKTVVKSGATIGCAAAGYKLSSVASEKLHLNDEATDAAVVVVTTASAVGGYKLGEAVISFAEKKLSAPQLDEFDDEDEEGLPEEMISPEEYFEFFDADDEDEDEELPPTSSEDPSEEAVASEEGGEEYEEV